MIKVIFRARNSANEWNRYFVDVSNVDVMSLNFANPLSDGRVKLQPIDEKLYLLDYLKVTFPEDEYFKVGHVINAIPKEILDKVYAIEFHMWFYEPWHLSLFADAVRNKHYVAFVALLTRENTGKDLPSNRLTNERPIGITDEDWQGVCREFWLDKKA